MDHWGYRLLWIIGDLYEGTVHKALFASIGVVLGGFIAHSLYLKKSSKMGNPICVNLGIYPYLALAAFVGLFVSGSLYAGYSLAIFTHYDKWQKYGCWYNTFTASLAQEL